MLGSELINGQSVVVWLVFVVPVLLVWLQPIDGTTAGQLELLFLEANSTKVVRDSVIGICCGSWPNPENDGTVGVVCFSLKLGQADLLN